MPDKNGDAASEVVSLRLTPAQLEQLQADAKRASQPVSDFIRTRTGVTPAALLAGPFRTGGSLGRTLYSGDTVIGLLDTAALAQACAVALNAAAVAAAGAEPGRYVVVHDHADTSDPTILGGVIYTEHGAAVDRAGERTATAAEYHWLDTYAVYRLIPATGPDGSQAVPGEQGDQ